MSWTANATAYGVYRRTGDSLHGRVTVRIGGVPTATYLSIYIPNSWRIDDTASPSNKVPQSTSLQKIAIGGGFYRDTSLDDFQILSTYMYAGTNDRIAAYANPSSGLITSPITNTYPITFDTSDEIMLEFSVPILGWTA